MAILKKYTTASLMGLLLIVILYTFYLKQSKAYINQQLSTAHLQIEQLTHINQTQQTALELINKQTIANRHYIQQLNELKKQAEQQVMEQTRHFKRLQHEDKSIRSWATQPLPDQLY